MNLSTSGKKASLLLAAFVVFLITFLSIADISFWEDGIPESGWWLLAAAQAVALWWAGRVLLSIDGLPQSSLARWTGVLARVGAIGTFVILLLLGVVEIWTEINDTLVDTAWGIVGVLTIVASVLLVVIVVRNDKIVFGTT